MSAHGEVERLLAEWLELTRAEAGAIQSAAWCSVGEIQSSKARLQTSLTRAVQQWTVENGWQSLPANHPFQARVGRLISLETRNAQLVAAQMLRVQAERRRCAEDLLNLRRLQRSYGRTPAKSWAAQS